MFHSICSVGDKGVLARHGQTYSNRFLAYRNPYKGEVWLLSAGVRLDDGHGRDNACSEVSFGGHL